MPLAHYLPMTGAFNSVVDYVLFLGHLCSVY
jgi:hypothetical protein